MSIKKDELLIVYISILIAVFVFGFDIGTSLAEDVVCGSDIGPGETVFLESDLGPCNTNRALTIEGPAFLNLNGHTVSCDPDRDGIRVIREKAVIINGTVIGCDDGLDIRGNGRHKIVNLIVAGNKNGIRVRFGSDNNLLINNEVIDNDSRGIRVESNDNYLINNLAEGNEKGIVIDLYDDDGPPVPAKNNKIVGNEANNNAKENYQIKGDYNRLVNNLAVDGDEECFLIEGNNNELVKNTAKYCADGFVLSNDDDGGDYNKIFNCKALKNQADGIVTRVGALENRIIHNRAFGNGYDLVDEHLNCDNNVWKRNKFDSSEPEDCIR